MMKGIILNDNDKERLKIAEEVLKELETLYAGINTACEERMRKAAEVISDLLEDNNN